MIRRLATIGASIAIALLVLASPAGPATAAVGWTRQSPSPTYRDLNGVGFASARHGFLVGDYRFLAETIDGGATWAVRSDGVYPADPYYDVVFLNASRGFIASNNAGYRTTDGGATWTPMAGVPAGSWRRIDFVSDTLGWMGANGAVARTQDGGASWQLLLGYPDAPIVYGMDFWDAQAGLIAGNQLSIGNGIFKSTDGGSAWTRKYDGYVNDVAFLDGAVAVAAGNDRLLRSSDGGETWVAVTPPGTGRGNSSITRVDPTTAVAVSDYGDIWRSTDAGRTWTLALTGIGTLPYGWRVSFVTGLDGWVVGPDGLVLRTTDGGATWAYASNGMGAHLADIEMASATLGLAVGENGYVLRTTDGGQRWTPSRLAVTGTIFGRTESLEAVTFLDADFAVAGGYGGILFKTADGGVTWESIGYPRLPGLFRIYDVEFVSRAEGWVVGADDDLGHDRHVYHTTDGGATWTLFSVDMPVPFLGVDFVDAQHGWIVGPRSFMLRTENGGGAWEQVPIPVPGESNLFFADVGFADQSTGWMVGTLGYVLRSTDGGRSWTRQNVGVTEDFWKIQVASASEAWAVTIQGTVLHTTDGGATWTREATGYTDGLSGISVVGERIWVAGFNGTILVNQVPPGQVVLESLAFDPAEVVGGQSSQGTVTLSGPAPAGGVVVGLVSSSPPDVSVPPSITVPAGASSATFTAQTGSATVDVAPTITASAPGSVSVSARLTALTMLRSVTVNPTSIVGGQTGQGRVTLGAPAPADGAVVELSTGFNEAATIPPSVTVAAGTTTASFAITTRAVLTSTWIVLLASYDGVSRNTMFEVAPGQAADKVAVTRAEYKRGRRQLRVEATSTSSSATLDVYVTATGNVIGRLGNLGGGRYGGQFSWPTNPESVTVRSSLGGSASAAVASR